MMKLKNVCGCFVLIAGLFATATPGVAAIVSLNSYLTNPSFENGTQANGCPIGWVCSTGGSPVTSLVKVAAPTASQYPAPNGLPSGEVPDGNSAAFSPSTGSVMTLSQSNLVSINGVDTYTLQFWLGNPAQTGPTPPGAGSVFPDVYVSVVTSTNNNNACDTSWNAGRQATLQSGATTKTDVVTNCEFNLTSLGMNPGDGKWQLYTLTYTPGSLSGIGGTLGVQFRIGGAAGAAENGALMHLDVVGPVTRQTNDVPEPQTLGLFGLGLLALGQVGMKRARRQR